MYTDPSGQFLWIPFVAAAIIFGEGNVIMNMDHVHNFWEGAGYFAIGAASYAAGYGVGAAVGGAISTVGFGPGMVTGAAGGFAGGFVSGTGNAFASGAEPEQAMKAGLISGGISAAISGLLGGLSGYQEAVAAGATNPWTGAGIKSDTYSTDVSSASEKTFKVGDGMEYTDDFAHEFSNGNFEPVEGLNSLTANGTLANNTYTQDGDWVLDSNGTKVDGTTVYKGWGRSNVYLNKSAFRAPKILYMAMGHEYTHVAMYHAGIFTLADQEATAYMWSTRQANYFDMNNERYWNNYLKYTYPGFSYDPTYFPNHANFAPNPESIFMPFRPIH